MRPVRNPRVGVFLSSKEGLPPACVAVAREVGVLLGRTGRTLVYGGARRGLMEVLARSARQSGARVYGIVPDILFERGWVSDCIDVTFRCADLSDRKAVMMRESDAFVVLPGGIGTLDEAFTVMANTVIGLRRQPVIFYDADGCWTPLLHALDSLFAQGFVSGAPADYYTVVRDSEGLARALDTVDARCVPGADGASRIL